MELEAKAPPPTLIGRLTQAVLVLGALYSLYLVLHPFTPLARQEIPILDIVQLQRSTHVLFLLLGGFLVAYALPERKRTLGAWVYFLLTLIPLYHLLFPPPTGTPLPGSVKAVGLLYWAVAALPALLPRLSRASNPPALPLPPLPPPYQPPYF